MSNSLKTIEELTEIFGDSSDILSIRLPYQGDADDIDKDVLKSFSDKIRSAFSVMSNSDLAFVPSRDGLVILSQDLGDNSEDFVDLVTTTVEEDYAENFDAKAVEVDIIPALGKSGLYSLAHDDFIAMEESNRPSRILRMAQSIRPSDFDRISVMDVKSPTTTGQYNTYTKLPRSPQGKKGTLRDPYFDPSPATCAIDIAILHKVTESIATDFSDGKLLTQYLPIHFPNLRDKRYMRCYESEFRNIPVFMRKFICPELVRIENGDTASSISEVAGLLHQYFEHIALSVTAEQQTQVIGNSYSITEITLQTESLLPNNVKLMARGTLSRLIQAAKRRGLGVKMVFDPRLGDPRSIDGVDKYILPPTIESGSVVRI